MAQHELKELLATAKRVEIVLLLVDDKLRDALLLGDPLRGGIWKTEPKPGWKIEADAEGHMTVFATEAYASPAGWHWAGTLALMIHNTDKGFSATPAMSFGMADVPKTPAVAKFVSNVSDLMMERATAQYEREIRRRNEN